MTSLAPFVILDRTMVPAPETLVIAECQDCACSVCGSPQSTRRTADPISAHQVYRRAPRTMVRPLAPGYWSAFNPMGAGGVVVLNDTARDLLSTFERPSSLSARLAEAHGETTNLSAAIGRLAGLGLLCCDDVTAEPAAAGITTLAAWLHLTDACNLRCSYCYVSKGPGDMTEVTAKSVVDAVLRSASAEGYRAIKLKYAGGEPSLWRSSLLDLHDYARIRCLSQGIDLQAVILTNGTMLDAKMIDGLGDRGIGVMVSLDGFDDCCEQQRRFSDGGSSVARVVAAIENMLCRGVRPHVSITITPQNIAGIARAVRFALEHDLVFSLNLYRAAVAGDIVSALRPRLPDLIDGIRAAYAVIEDHMPRWSVTGTVLDRGQLVYRHRYPCGAGREYLVFDHRGKIAACQLQMERVLARLEDPNPLATVRKCSQESLHNVPSEEKEGCRDCDWRDWCAGGCPLLTHAVTGRSDVPSPYCSVYQAIFPEALRLEGLRVLRYTEPARLLC